MDEPIRKLLEQCCGAASIYAAPGKNLDAVPAPTLLYGKFLLSSDSE
jgi:hypothetical protein